MNLDRVVEDLFRRESGRLVALLVRHYGLQNYDLAEDVVQETLLRALKHWAIKGVPENPAAWLTLTAKNLALDNLRRHAAFDRCLPALAEPGPEPEDERDRVALMFACCDPALPVESQIALTLHALGGMSSAEIAGCLVCQPNTVEQRVSRAKKLLREAAGSVGLPDPAKLPERLDSVLTVVYQVFAAGYSAHAGNEAVRIDLCADALFLVSLLRQDSATNRPQTIALHAVLLFCAARLPARTDDLGNVFRLEAQDRSLWDSALIAKAFSTLEESLHGDRVSRYHIEAAIHAEHARAASFETTDWPLVVEHYEDLVRVADSPIVRLNCAIAIGLARGPGVGLDALEELTCQPAMVKNSSWHAARARFLFKLGRQAESHSALALARDHADNDAERRHFERLLLA